MEIQMDMTMEQKIYSQVNEIGGEMLQGILEMVKTTAQRVRQSRKLLMEQGLRRRLKKHWSLEKGWDFQQ